ncbi:phoenix isoform X4 [Pseudorasbora parva]|uniref:phoenix isoform X4 n=1 Tax=Pseudorasbora parva TaxID=51549 RepID=UPI00351DFEA8
MALNSEDVRTQIETPNTQQIVPVVAHVSDLIELDPRSELYLESPPPDVVSSINACFEQFTSTLERRRDASVHRSSDSDSGESLFVTQSVTKAVRTARRPTRSFKRPESISDDTSDERDGVTSRLPENEDSEYEEGSEDQHALSPNRGKRIDYVPPQKATFPFLMKTHRRRHLPLKKHQILENSEIGGFLKCIKKLNEGYVKTGRAISPYMLESELSENSEDDHSSDHEVTKVPLLMVKPALPGTLRCNLPGLGLCRRTLHLRSRLLQRGRRPAQLAPCSPRRRGQPLPPSARWPTSSLASSYSLVVPTIPAIGKWTVAGLRQALANSEVQFSRKLTTAELYNLYVSLQPVNCSTKSTPEGKPHTMASPTASVFVAGCTSPPPASHSVPPTATNPFSFAVASSSLRRC